MELKPGQIYICLRDISKTIDYFKILHIEEDIIYYRNIYIYGWTNSPIWNESLYKSNLKDFISLHKDDYKLYSNDTVNHIEDSYIKDYKDRFRFQRCK